MSHKHAEIFKKITHAVLENDGPPELDDGLYASYYEGPISSMVSESPRLVATYKLVKVQLLVKKQRVEVVKQRKRRSKK